MDENKRAERERERVESEKVTNVTTIIEIVFFHS